jgi:hypothetical protein
MKMTNNEKMTLIHEMLNSWDARRFTYKNGLQAYILYHSKRYFLDTVNTNKNTLCHNGIEYDCQYHACSIEDIVKMDNKIKVKISFRRHAGINLNIALIKII